MNPIKTYSALVATMIFWGLSFVATKVALENIPTFTLVFVRFALAALIFIVLRRGWKWPDFTRKDHVKMDNTKRTIDNPSGKRWHPCVAGSLLDQSTNRYDLWQEKESNQ